MLPVPRRKSQKWGAASPQNPQQQYKVYPGNGESNNNNEDDDDDAMMASDLLAHDTMSDNKDFIVEETTNAANSISKWWRVRKLQNRIKSKWTPDHLRKVRERQRQVRVQRRIREIVLYVIYLGFMNHCILSQFNDSTPFYFTHNIKNLFMKTPFLSDDNHTYITFDNIRSISMVHRWLRGPFYSALFSQQNPNTGDYMVLQYGQIVGGISVGQLRVKRQECSYKLPPNVGDNKVYWCYGTDTGHFDLSVESVEPFGAGNGSNFEWDSGSSDSNVSDTRKKFFSAYNGAVSYAYPAPAYRIVIPHDKPATALAELEALEQLSYIDIQTRTVFVDFTLLNVMLGSILVARFAFEFPPSGGVVATSETTLVPYAKAAIDPLGQNSMIVVGVFFALYFLLLLRACRRLGWPIFRRLDTWIQLLNLLSFIIMWLLRLTASLDFPDTHVSSMDIESFRSFAQMFELSQRFAAAICFFSYMRLVLFLDILPHVNLIVKTIFASVVEIGSFVFVFGLLIYAYATCYCVIFGTSVEMFSTVNRSYTSLLQSLVGDIEYAELRATSPVMAACLFIAFTLLAIYVILHIAIAMVIDAYWSSKESTNWEKVNLVTETLSYIWMLGHQSVHGIAKLFGISAYLDEKFDDAKAKYNRSTRLSLVQKLVVKPLVSTQAKLEKLGHSLTQNQLIRTGVDGIRRGTQLVHQTTHVIADRLQSFGDENVRHASGRSRLNSSRHLHSFGDKGNGAAASESQMKAVQGMIIQLAHQNTKIQQTLNTLQAQLMELRDHSADDDDALDTATDVTLL